MVPSRLLPLAAVLALLSAAEAHPGEALVTAPTFEATVRPILKAHCFHCHGEEGKPKGGLDLRWVRAMVLGGESGPAVESGRLDESLLWERVEADEMPPGDKKLSAREKAALAEWIGAGVPTARPEPETLPPPGPILTEEERNFWSFRPIARADPPEVAHPGDVRNPIDAFLLARLEQDGLTFAPEADKPSLIRRATFDLTGLPPSVEEVEAFLADTAPDAYDRLIDRLLASPHHGERWARHWLDVVGYADSDGEPSKDTIRPYAYHYRDYIIRSLNADRSWDELIREQLGGDEMLVPPYQDLKPEDRDRLIATGYLRMVPDTTGEPGVDAALARDEVVADAIKVVSSSLLGLTVGCAQCHSHRYDPISQDDYFRFRAIFDPAYNVKQWRTPTQRLVSLWSAEDRVKAADADARVEAVQDERKAKVAELVALVLEREMADLPEEFRPKVREALDTPVNERTDDQKELLKAHPRVLVSPGNVSLYDSKAFGAITSDFDKKAVEAGAGRPAEAFVHATTEVPGPIPITRLNVRGDPKQPSREVTSAELTVLAGSAGSAEIPAKDPSLPTTGRRLAYARRLTDGKHPLAARVWVNRIWMHHFGRGIVATPSDFGSLGDRPTHPELLDWLAADFMAGGWKLKRLHRQIMTSTAYRQTSRQESAVDPDNRLLGRMPVRRLEAEAVRDAILKSSGKLDPTMFGPPLPVALDESGQVLIGKDTRDSAGRQRGKPGSLGGDEFRRSLYIQVRRSLPLSFSEAFDIPTLSPNCERRSSSTVATQSLALMNNEFAVEQSLAFADRVIRLAGSDPATRVDRAWWIALGHGPTAEQKADAVAFLAEQSADLDGRSSPTSAPKGGEVPPTSDPGRAALATLGQVLFGSNAFLYVD
ncbi:PSD1 and planctomycete cytochrome C domain-containing protein [Tundrisphaera lichenicola]|uniref:PSD1 and planctomycete cytochrome C domain-containing protein n=1 Tax=Tundrisphaera lichenicola TaxID=2029860 RepID=UPI003EB6A26B